MGAQLTNRPSLESSHQRELGRIGTCMPGKPWERNTCWWSCGPVETETCDFTSYATLEHVRASRGALRAGLVDLFN